MTKQDEKTEREIVIPGEVIAEGEDYLPGDNAEKRGDSIVAIKYGLADKSGSLVKVIPLSGVYEPRKGNVVIGKVEDVNFNGWLIDIGTAHRSFLPLTEVPRFINKNALEEFMDIGDMVVVRLDDVSKKGILVSVKSRNLGKLDEGLVMEINPHKVPRVIGREGSMVRLIKEKTGCRVVVGQNGLIWIKGDSIDDELLAKKSIIFVTEKSAISGLTDAVEEWFSKQPGTKTKESSEDKEINEETSNTEVKNQ